MLQGIIIIYYGTLSRGVGFKIWMMLEMESVPKLLHSHLPNQVIEPFPRITPPYHLSSNILPLTQTSTPKSNFKIPSPHTLQFF